MSAEFDPPEIKFAHMMENMRNKVKFGMGDMVDVLKKELALTTEEAKIVSSFFLEEIDHAIKNNVRVSIPPIGIFHQSYRKATYGSTLNPYTREEVYTHARRFLNFTGSTRLYARMNTPEKYRSLYKGADEHTLILEEPEYDLDNPHFTTYEEGLAKGYTEEEIIKELTRQAREEEHYYTLEEREEE